MFLASGACAEWPRYAHPVRGRSVPAGAPVDVNWQQLGTESEVNDWPDDPGVFQAVLGVGDGVTMAGTLAGTGYAGGDPLQRGTSECANAPAQRYPMTEGEYTGDVDTLVVEVLEGGVFCARAALGAETAFDLLLLPIDRCDLPGAPLTSGGDIVGLARGGASASWSLAVEPGRYALQLAAWDPIDPAVEINWNVDVSIVEDACPAERP